MSNVSIYTLSDPRTGEVRYVGKTTQSLRCRLSSHLCRKRNTTQSHKNKNESWIESLRRLGLTPKIELLSQVPQEQWEAEEKFYISYLRYIGVRLNNHSEGGDKSNLGSRWRRSRETQKKLDERFSDKHLGLTLFNSKGSPVRKFRNFYEASEFLCEDRKSLYKKVSAGTALKGQLFLVRDGKEVKFRPARHIKVKVALASGEVLRFGTVKEAAKLLGKDSSDLCKLLKSNGSTRGGHKIQYDDSMSF